MREELHEYLLALVLTAVLIWYTYVSIPHTSARAASREPRDAEERGGGGAATATTDEAVDELDWPEYLEEA
jgi:hypothetical protein